VNSFEPFLRFGLLLVRPGVLVMAAPPFGAPYAPMPVRLGLTLLFTFVLATGALPTVQPGSTLSQVGRYLTVLGLAFGIIGALLLQRWWALRPPSNAA